jgi:hypothetical protein
MVMQGPGMSLLAGGVYGIVWWVLGPLLIMPLAMGMPVFQNPGHDGKSLWAHHVWRHHGHDLLPLEETSRQLKCRQGIGGDQFT